MKFPQPIPVRDLARRLDARQIIGDEKRPVVFVFAGKAHPADVPGQDLIRRICQVARMPEFEGRVLFTENYDLRLARRLVSGVDVWCGEYLYAAKQAATKVASMRSPRITGGILRVR